MSNNFIKIAFKLFNRSSLEALLRFIRLTGQNARGDYQFTYQVFGPGASVPLKEFLLGPHERKTFAFALSTMPQPTDKFEGELGLQLEIDRSEQALTDANRANNVLAKTLVVPPRASTVLDFSLRYLLLTDKNFASLMCQVRVLTPYNLLLISDRVQVKHNNEILTITNIERDTSGVGRYRIWFTPPHEAGDMPLEVLIAGRAAANTVNLTVYGWPQITAVTPQPARLGETITIRGYNFIPNGILAPGQGVTAAGFTPQLNLLHTYKFISPEQVQVTVPYYAASGPMVVWVGMQQLEVPLLVHPEIRAFYPVTGRPGDAVTVYVAGIASFDPARDRIEINGVPMPVDQFTGSSIVVRIPSGATTGKIRLIKTVDSGKTGLSAASSSSATSMGGSSASALAATQSLIAESEKELIVQ